MRELDPSVIGQDGSIQNFMRDIEDHARLSNGFVIELGSGLGTGSTYAIQRGLQGHPDALHFSIDLLDRMIWKPDTKGWKLLIGDSRSEASIGQVAPDKARYPGLIFVDTVHTYAQLLSELKVWEAVAGLETVWLFHDTYMHGTRNTDMIRAIEEHIKATGWVYDDYRTEAHGLGRMSWKRGIPFPDRRTFEATKPSEAKPTKPAEPKPPEPKPAEPKPKPPEPKPVEKPPEKPAAKPAEKLPKKDHLWKRKPH